ncbi:MAG: hypothetical protein GC201_16400 [Alphaproteobacteria bacterium]|nr:hypothetical protein [Alphaproteobacteria bacterium]
MAADTETLIAIIEKNSAEEIRARMCSYRGRPFVDFRIFVDSDAADERIPTKKGIAVRPDLLEAFRDLIDQAIAARDAE